MYAGYRPRFVIILIVSNFNFNLVNLDLRDVSSC